MLVPAMKSTSHVELFQHLENAHVGEAARAATAQHQAHARPLRLGAGLRARGLGVPREQQRHCCRAR